jgi:hypothetical protein
MEDLLYEKFRQQVDECLVRHRSILDVLSKLQEGCARTNRSITKAVTNCGCLEINASKQAIPQDASLATLKKYMEPHLEGKLCPNCREIFEDELGATLFYLVALCNLLDVDLLQVMLKEYNKLRTLGIFNLS